MMKCFFVVLILTGAVFTPAEAKAPYMFGASLTHLHWDK